MTEEEVTRFALQLREAERIRAQIAEDEAAADVSGGYDLPLLVSPPTVDQEPYGLAVVAA